MTKYWPLSTLHTSPLMPAIFDLEFRELYHTMWLSTAAFQACGRVALQIQPVETDLVVIETLGGPPRRMYTQFPTWGEWSRLERGGVMAASDGQLHVIIDGLH